MDKNTIIGFVLIAAVLIGFSWYSQPSAEEIAAQHTQDSLTLVAKQRAEKQQKAAEDARKKTLTSVAKEDTTVLFYASMKGTAQNIVLKNSKVELTLSTKGGTVAKAVIKNFKDHNGNKDVTLFTEKDQRLNFLLAGKNSNIITEDLFFTPSQVTDSTVTMTATTGRGQAIVLHYLLGKDYMLHASMQVNGMADLFAPTYRSMDVEWTDKARQQERGFTFENRYSTLTYHLTKGGTDYLNATSEKKDEPVEETIDWIAFKNQFFSAVMIAKNDFAPNSLMTSIPQEKGSGYLKDYAAKAKTFFDLRGKPPQSLNFISAPMISAYFSL